MYACLLNALVTTSTPRSSAELVQRESPTPAAVAALLLSMRSRPAHMVRRWLTQLRAEVYTLT